MTNLFKNNAYQVLGLDISASQKDIVKRAKEIQNYIHIDEHPEYPNDLTIYKAMRNAENIKESLQVLSQPEKRIREYFFWFEIRSSIDESAIQLINNNEYDEALKLWTIEMDKSEAKSYSYKKNLAVAYSILVDTNGEKKYLDKSLSYWSNLIENDEFWTHFIQNYKVFDDLNTREDILKSFKQRSPKYLADFYLDVSNKFEDKSVYESYYTIFKIKGSKVDETFLRNTYQQLESECELLKKFINKDLKEIPHDAISEINASIIRINQHFKSVKDLGLFNSSEVKVERDNVAEVLLSLSIFLHNNHNLSKEALFITEEASTISGTDSMKGRIKENIKIIKEVIESSAHQNKFNSILTTAKDGDVDKAINLINIELQNTSLPLSVKQLYIETKNTLENRVRLHGKPIKSAPSMTCINGCGTKMYGDTLYFVLLFIPIIPWSRYSVKDLGNGSFSFFGKLELHQWQKIWKYIGLILIGLFLIYIFSSGSGDPSSSTPSTSSSNSGSGVVDQCNDESCNEKYSNTIYSAKDSPDNSCTCICSNGYMWNESNTGCIEIDYDELCKKKFGQDSTWTGRFEGDSYLCN